MDTLFNQIKDEIECTSIKLFMKGRADIYDPLPPAAKINPTVLFVQHLPVSSIRFLAAAFKS